ncbi:hypothetical protein L4D09_12890 [Photobacterium makurazakiensis]|uniref:alpha/beta hydrolase family protein n=1 Tax=Photobacterium makurazakiensis TaxID=2910234 RepID=UPI003D0C474B
MNSTFHIFQKIRLFPFSFFLLFTVLAGCTSTLQKEALLSYKVREPLNLKQYQQASWFQPSKHTIKAITVTHDDGLVVKGLRLSVNGSENTVLYFGGTPYQDGLSKADILGQFAFLGLNVIAINNRGLDSHGEWPSLRRLKADADNVYDQVRQAHPHDFLIVHGTAMSNFWVSDIASRHNTNAIVVEGVITNFEEAIEQQPWWKRWKKYSNIADELQSLDMYQSLAGYEGPVLLLASEGDRWSTPDQNQKLHGAISSLKKSVETISTAEPTDLLMQDDTLAAYMMFVKKYGYE